MTKRFFPEAREGIIQRVISMSKIKAGKYKNLHGETIEVKLCKDTGYFVNTHNNGDFYTDSGTCLFWSTGNERFFMNTDPKRDLDLYGLNSGYSNCNRNAVIDECIKALGHRYGAAAIKDLHSLKTRK